MPICGPNQSLTNDQVAQYMRNAGFPESAIPTGLAVAMGESGLQSGNCNLSDPNGGSFGLWQINGAHFSSGASSQQCAFDPQCATNFAYQLWQQNGWQPWGAYTNGSYQQYLNPNFAPTATGGNRPFTLATSTGSGGCTCDAGYSIATNGIGQQICKNNSFPFDARPCRERQVQDPLTQISNFLSVIGPWFTNPVRIIKLVFGIVLIAGAIFLLTSPQGELLQATQRFSKQAGFSRLGGGK